MTSTRSPQLLAGLCAALVAAVLLVAPAAEAKAITRSISIAVAPTAAVAGTGVTFSGKLTKSPKGSAVKIQRKVGSTWKLAKATSTKTAAGAYAVKVTLPSTAGVYHYRAYAPKKGSRKAATSKVISVAALRQSHFRVIPQCGCPIIYPAPGQVPANEAMTVGGSVNKQFSVGALITLQWKDGTQWTPVGTAHLNSTGGFVVTDHHATTGQYRVVLSRKGLNSGAATPPVLVTMGPATT
jgi:hypothetical protein